MINKILLALFLTSLLCFILFGCAFIPREVKIDSIKQRVVYPHGSYTTPLKVDFETFTDRRSDKEKLGVARNKLMMITTSIYIEGDLNMLFEEMTKQNFAANGIGDGISPFRLKGEILEASTDAVGPDHIFVQVIASLTLINAKNNVPIFHKILKGYKVTPVTQIANRAWEDAFIGAMNQINDQIGEIAQETLNVLYAGKQRDKIDKLTGSCAVVSPNGLILTAYHIIENFSMIKVHLTDERILEASVVQTDSTNDLALLKISGNTPNYLPLAPLRSTRVGQQVFTIGFPAVSLLGKEPKFTEGTISALSGPHGIASILQISVPVQPGNSGGPLVNDLGELVGMITSTASVSQFIKETGMLPQNVNWAIKVDYIRPLFDAPVLLGQTKNREEAIDRTNKAACFIEAFIEGY